VTAVLQEAAAVKNAERDARENLIIIQLMGVSCGAEQLNRAETELWYIVRLLCVDYFSTTKNANKTDE
jgi:hypothetical protein